MIPGESLSTPKVSTFWACMTACWKSDLCFAGTYLPSSQLCNLKADNHPQAEQTAYSKANKVKSFDFTCSTTVKVSKSIKLEGSKLKSDGFDDLSLGSWKNSATKGVHETKKKLLDLNEKKANLKEKMRGRNLRKVKIVL